MSLRQHAVTAQCVLLLLVILRGCDKAHSQDSCGVIGQSDQAEHSRLTDLRFYLNTQTPAQCSGNVTTWEYCYYSPDVTAGEYHAPFGIYRLNGTSYELVSPMFLIVISDDDIGSSSFTCGTLTTPVTTIQQGDVVGTCVHDVVRGLFGGTRAQLNLAGGSAAGYSVQFADTSNSRCNTGVDVAIPGSVSQGDLSSLSSTILHLHANITVSSTTTTEQPTMEATTETPTTVEMTTEPPTTMSQPTTMDTTSSLTNTVTLASTIEQQTTMMSDPTSESDSTETSMTNGNQSTTLATSETTTKMPIVADTNDSSTGVVIGVAVGLLLILIISVVLILTVFLVRKKRTDSYKITNSVYHTSNPNAIENVMYDDLASKAQFEASNYEIPFSDHLESQKSTELDHNYYELVSIPPVSDSICESPLDSNAVSFSALLQKNQREDIYAGLQPYHQPSTQDTDAIYSMIRAFGIIDIPRLVIRSVGHHLGSGQFANVEEGTWKKGVNKEVRVALKTMKQGTTEEDKIKFLQEAAIMAQFRHPNVISLHGVVSKGDPIILVTELMEMDLRHYLGFIRPDPGELPPADLPTLQKRCGDFHYKMVVKHLPQ